ncbi:MAG: ATP12 family protein [Alphaproteobacteria bacterium]
MKRFYSMAEVAERNGGFTVVLDGRPVRTPAKASLSLPTRALAEAVAEEWRAQEEEIRPQSMRLMRLAVTAIDRVSRQRDAVIEEIAAYAATDLVCYRAEQPASLAARQQAAWQPLVDWAARRYDARLRVTAGLMPVQQPQAATGALRSAVAVLDDMMLTGLHNATAACGSAVIALALAEGRVGPDEAWELSLVDETFQVEQWGEDGEAARRHQALREDIASAARFMELSRP